MWLWISVAAAILVIVILLSIVLLDLSRVDNQRRSLDRSVMSVLSAALAAMIESTQHNLRQVRTYLDPASRGKPNVGAWQSLSLEYWKLVAAQPPKVLVQAKLLERLAEITARAHQVNYAIEARDQMRTSIPAGEPDDQVRILDEEVQQSCKRLLDQVEELAKQVEGLK